MMRAQQHNRKRGTVLLMVVGLLAMLFMLVTAYITLARFERLTHLQVVHGQQVEEVAASVSDLLAAKAARPNDGDLATGLGYLGVPGYGDMKWCGALEPMVLGSAGDGTQRKPGEYGFSASTSLGGNADPNDLVGATNLSLARFMLDKNPSVAGADVDPYNPTAPASKDETLSAAREPLGDADGDGIADSSFVHTAVVTELANAMTGTTVSADGVDPSDFETDPNNVQQWNYIRNTARYVGAVRVIPHGGMVQISQPSENRMWNTEFLTQMFNWVKNPQDAGTGLDASNVDDRKAMQGVYASRSAVEALLRVRGGVLAGEKALSGDASRSSVPSALRDWVTGTNAPFSLTFGTPGGRTAVTNEAWQRFNIASATDWDAWRWGVTISADDYNTAYTGGDPAAARLKYRPRHLLTAENNSDELAWVQGVGEDPNDIDVGSSSGVALELHAGETKYFLGRITGYGTEADPNFPAMDPNDITKCGAFDYNTDFRFLPDADRGTKVISDLARYFGEMLTPYKGWKGGGSGTEAVSRREQALMLAVNTVAFAAPRLHGAVGQLGQVDAVYVDDVDPVGGGYTRYIGYAPQPFITQVVVCNKPKKQPGGDPNSPAADSYVADLALAVELYNPHESAVAGATMTHDLHLSRFALSVNANFSDPNNPPMLFPLDGSGVVFTPSVDSQIVSDSGSGYYLPGRCFMALALDNTQAAQSPSDNTEFHDKLDGNIGTLKAAYNAVSDKIRVQLWRRGSDVSALGWYMVDELVVEPKKPPGGTPPTEPGGEQKGWYVNVTRNTQPEAYWGVETAQSPLPAGLLLPARWRMVTAFEPDDSEYKQSDGDSDPPADLIDTELRKGDDTAATEASPPPAPLITMNADATSVILHGAARPASFPTVGFMQFVPRFAHKVTLDASGAVLEWKPMTRVLRDQWKKQMDNSQPPLADFGHMPIFDNRQELRAAAPLKKIGEVPWGLLVYDYFTTLNPRDANGDGQQSGTAADLLDPYRVPGRINVNMAPWYVLAGLPVIVPQFGSGVPDATGTQSLPLESATNPTNADPAFWSKDAGLLAGVDSNLVARFPATTVIDVSATATAGQWARLGPYLAEAAAAFRDRLPYATTVPTVLMNAVDRGATTPYRPASYKSVRGEGEASARGFVGLGELANIPGFDGSSWDELALASPDETALGKRDFLRAAGFMALLDTHFLTTRSNTFTLYVSLTDQKDAQASFRSQATIDRSNTLPRRVGTTTIESVELPELVGERQAGYLNTRYDD